MSTPTSEIGTERKCRGGLTMSVDRGRPEVAGRGSKRRDWPIADPGYESW